MGIFSKGEDSLKQRKNGNHKAKTLSAVSRPTVLSKDPKC